MDENEDNSDAPGAFSIFNKNNLSNNFFGDKNINEEINEAKDQINDLEINNNFEPKKIKLKPRDYQEKIFEKAKNQNSIIFVETGKGKTFISIMLMADLLGIDINSDEKPKYDKKKKIIFFVCDTALVEQQKSQIQNILGVEVGTIQGKKDKKSKNDYDSFRKKWDSLSIFVAIPSIIYKLLSCGFINIFQISMLIFDECHHTADDHPYNKIMKEFYFFYKKKLDHLKYPRIYGLTASPMKTGIKNDSLEITAYEALNKLSENLDCVVVIDPEMINSNAKEMRPGENIDHYLDDDTYIEVIYHTEIKEFKTIFMALYNECFFHFLKIGFADLKCKQPELSDDYNEKQYSNYLKQKYKSINLEEYNKICQNYDYLYNLKKFSPFFIIFEKIQRHIFMILENLCLDSLISYFSALIENYTSIYIQKNEGNNININNKSVNCSIKSSDSEEDEDDETDVLSLAPESILELKEIFSNIYEKLKEIRENQNYISDRLKQLFVKIDDLFKSNNNSKFIIFIANRIVAHFLKPALTSFLKKKHKNKKCDEIIGINKQKSGGGTTLTPSLTLKKLNEIISNFNEDNFDILIGTSAIEEGLDIQSCNAVLALVELNTPKSFIQIKGRARKSNSKFYIFTNSAIKAKLKIKNFITIGKKMKDLFEGQIIKDFRTKDYIYRKPDFFYEFDESSHAKITMGNVSIFFNEIKQQIEACKIKFKCDIDIKQVRSQKGSQEYDFIGIINIETSLFDLNSKSPYKTDRQSSKDNAKNMCFFYALLKLKQLKYLDNHLKFCQNKIK